MKFILVLFLLCLASGCVVTPVSVTDESMLPNGDWSIRLLSNVKCSEYYQVLPPEGAAAADNQSAVDFSALKDAFKQTKAPTEADKLAEKLATKTCMDKFKNSISSRSSELCGNRSFELYACINSEEKSDQSGLQYGNNGYGYYMTCYLHCKK